MQQAYFTERQLEQLLKPLNPARVETLDKAGQSLSYLNHADVRAHLTRIFGFGRWDSQVLETELLFEEQVEGKDKKPRWYIGWRASVQLRVRSPEGDQVAVYAECAVGGNTQPQRHEASDMALKSAVSDALKRCAMNLGSQFGLSLYGGGGKISTEIGRTLWPEQKLSESGETLPEPEVSSPTEHDGELAHAIGYSGGSDEPGRS